MELAVIKVLISSIILDVVTGKARGSHLKIESESVNMYDVL